MNTAFPKSAGGDRPWAAWPALRRLIADPNDTAQVFRVIRALGGPSLARGLRRFRATAVGRRVMAEEVDLIDALRDRARLAALPTGTLGRAYYEFTGREQITADGLAVASAGDAAADPASELGADMRRYAERLRDQHDLWHVVTRYGRDPFGEVCLLAFTYAQAGDRGVGVIALVGAWRLGQALGPAAWRAVWAAYRAGRRARWLPEQDWETLLGAPLEDVRRRLAVPPPAAYLTLRSAIAR